MDNTRLFTVTLRERWVRSVFPAEGLPAYDDIENATGLTVEAHDGDQGSCDSATCCYLVRAESADEIRAALAKWREDVLADCDDADDMKDSAAALAGALDLPVVVEANDGDRWAEQGTIRGGHLVGDFDPTETNAEGDYRVLEETLASLRRMVRRLSAMPSNADTSFLLAVARASCINIVAIHPDLREG